MLLITTQRLKKCRVDYYEHGLKHQAYELVCNLYRVPHAMGVNLNSIRFKYVFDW